MSITDCVIKWFENKENSNRSYYLLEIFLSKNCSPYQKDDALAILRYMHDHHHDVMLKTKIINMLTVDCPHEAKISFFKGLLN
jgi:hypothetical protein